MTPDDVRLNYNEVGVAIIEQMYGTDGYLSPGGAKATDLLAPLTDISRATRVLDVGSGLGGPAMRLARAYGCRVTGLELVESSVRLATERAGAAGLGRQVDFRVGDATAIPFEAEAFDMIWSQDALCHVPDKGAVIGQCARVLRPGGTMAFTDWLLQGEDDVAYRRDVLPALASPGLETSSGYIRLLERYGFTGITADDVSGACMVEYDAIMERIRNAEEDMTKRFGPKVFAIVLEKNGFIQKAFQDQQLGGGRFVATLPA